MRPCRSNTDERCVHRHMPPVFWLGSIGPLLPYGCLGTKAPRLVGRGALLTTLPGVQEWLRSGNTTVTYRCSWRSRATSGARICGSSDGSWSDGASSTRSAAHRAEHSPNRHSVYSKTETACPGDSDGDAPP